MPTISTLTVDVETNPHKFVNGLTIATGALTALAAGAAYAFGQFQESEKITAQTGAVLKSTGDAANVTAKQVTDLANSLAMKSGIDDEAIQTGENMILTFKNISNEAGKGNDIFDQTTKAVLDMSVAMGQDMKSSAIQVGKALNDPITGMSALQRVGVTFTEAQKAQITQLENHNHLLQAQKIILGELTSEFGGSAAAQATETGKMSVALGNLAETIGGLLAPAVTFLAGKLAELAGWLQDHVGPAFKAVGDWAKDLWEKVQPLAEIVGGLLVKAWQAVQAEFKQLLPDLKKLWVSLQPVLKVVGEVIGVVLILALKALPVVIHAIGDFIDTVVKILAAVGKVLDGIGAFVSAVIGFFGRLVDGTREKFGTVVDFIKAIPGRIKDFFANAPEWLFNAGRDVLIGLWNGMKSMFSTIWNGLTSWVSNLIDHVKGFLHIGSPSKVFEEIGVQMMAGMDQGIQKGSSDVRGTLAGFTPSLSGVGAMGAVSGDLVLQIDGQTFARIQRDQLLKLKGSRSTLGLS